MTDVFLKGVGHYVPKGRITNEEVMKAFLEENRDTLTDEELKFAYYGYMRKLEFLGSVTRAAVTESESYVQMAVDAAKAALDNAGMKPEAVECLVATGISNPMREPSLAAVVGHQIGMDEGIFFDINDACNGFMKSLTVARMYIQAGSCENALIVACESPMEMKDPLQADLRVESVGQIDNKFSNLMLGSGAGACVMGKVGQARKMVNLSERAQSTDWDASIITLPEVTLPETRYFSKTALKGFWTDARKISSKWRRGSVEFIKDAMKSWGANVADFDLVLLHQLGDNVTFSIMQQLGIHKSKAPLNTFNEFGNLGAANVPVLVSIATEKDVGRKGDNVLLISGGGGFSYSAAHVVW